MVQQLSGAHQDNDPHTGELMENVQGEVGGECVGKNRRRLLVASEGFLGEKMKVPGPGVKTTQGLGTQEKGTALLKRQGLLRTAWNGCVWGGARGRKACGLLRGQ